MPRKKNTPSQAQQIERISFEIVTNPPDKMINHDCIGFITPLQAQFGLPHKELPGNPNEWERVNGNSKLRIVSESGAGIPSGSTPRCGFAWVATWQVKHPKETYIPLGKNLSTWMRDEMHLQITGGKHGTITKQKLELFKLFTSSISVTKMDRLRGGLSFEGTGPLARKMELWHNTKSFEQDALFPSYIILNTDFRELLLEHPIPIDLRALPALRKSPLAIDYYCWLASRLYRLTEATLVPWEQLQVQFGSNYDWTDKRSRFKFRHESERQLRERVLKVYPHARIHIRKEGDGLLLFKSQPPVPPTTRKMFLAK